MGQRIAPSVTIRNVIEKLVESGAVDEDVATAWRSGRENLEGGRRNDADAQPPMRDRRGGIDGWLQGFGAFQQPNREGGALERFQALMEEVNEMNERLQGLMEEDEDDEINEQLQALMEDDEDNDLNEQLDALDDEDVENHE